jgi:hypothetical protein
MALIGTIGVGATAVFNLDFCPEKLLVVDAVTGVQAFANITAFSLVNAGRQVGNITGARVAGMARVGKMINGASQILSESLQTGAGRVTGSTTITLTSNSANILNVFAVSGSFSNVITQYIETSINANANQSFTDFSALILSTPANVDRVNITFANGFNDDFTVSELRQLAGEFQNTNADGQLNGGLLVPNFVFGDNPIQTAIVFVNGSGSCVVAIQRFAQSR